MLWPEVSVAADHGQLPCLEVSVDGVMRSATILMGMISKPVLRFGEQLCEQRFPGAWLSLVAVLPTHQGGERHQDRFGATVRLQPEDRSLIPDEAEFHITTASIC